MKIVSEILEKVEQAGSRVVVVTKYFDEKKTHDILRQAENHPAFWALGENRIKDIKTKKLPREKTHFIGNLQSRDLEQIVQCCSVLHSLCSVKHAEILNKKSVQEKISVFLQINISREKQKKGLLPKDIAEFLSQIATLKNLEILGFSAIGLGEFTESQKREEFRELKRLRDQFLPGKILSAGTSRDYHIALEEGIEVVRIGQAFFDQS